jgi:hypothetical protein
MRKYFLYTLLILALANSCGQKTTVEPNIFCMLSNTVPGNNSSVGIDISTKDTYFGKEFWQYLFEKYPASAEIIFKEEPVEGWVITKFYSTNNPNIDTGKSYFLRTLDNGTRKKLAGILRKNSATDRAVYSNYSKFKRMITDTTFNTMSIYCEEETLRLIQAHKY